MNCKQAQPNLLEYSRGLLKEREAQAVQAHLDDCAECRAYLQSELEIAEGLAVHPRLSPDHGKVWSLVESRIQQQPERTSVFEHLQIVFGRKMTAVTAAFAVVILVAVLLLPRIVTQPDANAQKQIAAQVAAMMQVQPVEHQADPVGTTDDMMSILQNEL